jgi:seryl-tRNA synthetase
MLDIRFIRENAGLVAEKSKQKGYEVDITQLLGFDKERLELQQQVEELRRQRNELAEAAKGHQPSEEEINKGRQLKEQLANLEHRFAAIDKEYTELLKQVPNMPAEDVPVGASEDENLVVKEWGEKPHFDFEPKSHWQIAEARGLIDKERAAKVAGSRFAYIKGDLVKLQFAIIQFALGVLTDEAKLQQIAQAANLDVSRQAFVPVLPPAMIKTDVYDAMDRLEPREDRYKVGSDEDDLWLQGSAEHTMGPMYANEIIDSAQLPIRYVGYATSFRREAGTYGKDTEGIIRMHQFDKLEMESFCAPEQGLKEHLFFVAIQEYLVQQLGLPYRVLQKCTADIGKPNARGVDLEVWLPGHGGYKETHTADFMTDYQSRRLNTRTKTDDATVFVHTNDATAFAMGRTMVAIIENYQNPDGTVNVPEALRPYMANASTI